MNFGRLCFTLGAIAAGSISARAQIGLPTLAQPVPPQVLNRGPADLDLRNYFAVPGVTGQIVQFTTSVGRFNVEMLSQEAPRHVENFLGYVRQNAYDNTLIHRTDLLGTDVPAMVQGGAYIAAVPIPPAPKRVTPGAPVNLEYRVPNTRGTLAANRSATDPNSATTEWFFNTINNTGTLGPSNGGGYSAFGRVLGTGMSVVDSIAQAPVANLGEPGFDRVPVRNITATQTQLSGANLMVVNSVRIVPIYPAASGDPTAVLSFVVTVANPSLVSATVAGSTLTFTPLAPGATTATVRAVDANGNSSVPTTFSITIPAEALLPPVFTAQPISQTVAAGSTVVFSAAASGGQAGLFPMRYRWFFNDAPLAAPEGPYLILRGVSSRDAGVYTALATNAAGSSRSTSATLTVLPASNDTGRLSNLAIRTFAGAYDETLIVGFAIGGVASAGAKPVLLRAVGPSLEQFGIDDFMVDPMAAVFQGSTQLAENDDWNGATLVAARSAQVGAFALRGPTAADSALTLSFGPGAYTLQVKGKDDGTGTALAEIYDATPAAGFNASMPRLINASARGQVGLGANIIVAGFVIAGTTPVSVMIRAIGPTLDLFGVPGALSNPKLQLFRGPAFLRENDDWGGEVRLSEVSAAIGAFPLADRASKDAVILVTLDPGEYTAQVSAMDNSSGIALVEVYEVK